MTRKKIKEYNSPIQRQRWFIREKIQQHGCAPPTVILLLIIFNKPVLNYCLLILPHLYSSTSRPSPHLMSVKIEITLYDVYQDRLTSMRETYHFSRIYMQDQKIAES